MSIDNLQEVIENIDRLMDGDNDDLNEKFEQVLVRMDAIDDFRKTEKLLLLLNDEYEYQDLMWEVLHRAEKCEAHIYTRAYADVIMKFHRKAPEWAERVLMRILNSDLYLSALIDALENTSKEGRRLICAQCECLLKNDKKQFGQSACRLLENVECIID